MNEKTINILKTAILLEKRGKSFYERVASTTSIPGVKEIFNMMADEEQAHIEYLSEQYINLLKEKKFKKFDLSQASADVTTVDKILSSDIKDSIDSASYEATAIEAAINMENMAIKIYSDRAEEATDLNEREMYQWLAKWEQTHHRLLHQLDKELKEKIWNDNSFWPF